VPTVGRLLARSKERPQPFVNFIKEPHRGLGHKQLVDHSRQDHCLQPASIVNVNLDELGSLSELRYQGCTFPLATKAPKSQSVSYIYSEVEFLLRGFLFFLHRPQKVSVFRETVGTYIGYQDVHVKFFVGFFDYQKYVLDGRSICSWELN
jgi:hypothetical protein